MKIDKISAYVRKLKRSTYAGVALVLVAVFFIPLITTVIVHASASGGLVEPRSIKMSSSTPSATASYDVSFKVPTSYTLKSIIIDFCSGSGDPIVGDSSCPDLAGFSLGTPTITNNPDGAANTVSVAGWTASAFSTAGNTPAGSHTASDVFELSNSTGVAVTGGTSIVNFSINGVTNSSTLGTFYARVLTYTSVVASTAYSEGGGEGTYQDYGGFALSTAQLINITAKIMEQLTFCTSSGTGASLDTDPFSPVGTNGVCSNAVTPSLTLGHEVTSGGPHILDTTHVDFAKAFSLLSTNATNGAIVRMEATNSCASGGLSATGGGSCDIKGIGDGTGAAGNAESAITLNTARFGLCASPDGDSLTTVDTPYDNSSGTGGTAACLALSGASPATANTTVDFGMDTTTTGTNSVVDTGNSYIYGTQVLHTGGAVHDALDGYIYAAAASDTTPAGIYTGGESLIATGTF